MQKQLQQILTRELSRKDFLATLGVAAASLVGLSALHRILAGKDFTKSSHSSGYSDSPYGR